MSASAGAVRVWLSFRRIVDVPFETCVAALDSWQPTGQDGKLRFGDSLPRGPIEHDRDARTCRIQAHRVGEHFRGERCTEPAGWQDRRRARHAEAARPLVLAGQAKRNQVVDRLVGAAGAERREQAADG